MIKVLIVDDSALVRTMLTEILQSSRQIEVVGAAQDPLEAREMIKRLKPDVLTLDIEMPKMNGITFLANLMRLRPMPVVMISTLTQAGAPATLEALELGAVDFLPKPKNDGDCGLEEYRGSIINKVMMAAKANISTRPQGATGKPVALPADGGRLRAGFICTIGASTGGTEAIKDVLIKLPKQCPPIVITQHIPATFSSSFAERLNNSCEINVFEAEDGQPIRAGCAYIAPGDKHLQIGRSAYGYVCKLLDGEPVNRHKPAVGVLFDSVLKEVGNKALAIMLTGMGADGAQSMLLMREAGCHTIAQDEATSVVWGMPGAAVKLGAASEVLPLGKVAERIMKLAYE